jgi:ATP-dependent Lon protease
MTENRQPDQKNANGEAELNIPKTLPLLPVRDIVVFPYMILPLFVGREISISAVNEALSSNRLMMLATQKNATVEEPGVDDLYRVGTVVSIMRMIKAPDGKIKILVQGLIKAVLRNFVSTSPFIKVEIERFEDKEKEGVKPIEQEALQRTVRAQVEKIIDLGKTVSPDILMVLDGIEDSGKMADLVASNLGLQVDSAQKILETGSPSSRLRMLSEFLSHEIMLLSLQEKIQTKTQNEMTKTQKEYYLREQMRQIQKELGETDDRLAEINELREKVEQAKMPEAVAKEAEKQIRRLEKMHPESAEAATIRTYVEWLIDMPWSVSTKDNIDIKNAKKVLDEDHYNLEKIKQRILEYLGVAQLKKDMKGPILCFVGPPGTGKTSLGKSIARALGRKFTRMSLGGIRDESEIRGHRRTYIGSLPGRIIQGIKNTGTNNPVFMLDEIDKLGADFRGDPSSALMEVLDPEQNSAFVDHYLAVPFDLSKVLFIATANWLDPIPGPLLDRVEVITLAGYTEIEKLHIAKKYLIRRQKSEHGIPSKKLKISDEAIREITNKYTREAGLRNLEQQIAAICRKAALKIAEGKQRGPVAVTDRNLARYIGPVKFLRESEKEKPQVGVATGLAWTQVGGTIMHIEVTTMKGKGNLTLTGKLGDVMKESAQAAYSYCRANAKKLGIPEDFARLTDIHIHVPAGAIPKDGPSAGIAIAVALASALSGKPVRNDVAMTGEITLRGRVLPIGGLKEKTLAALQAGIDTVIVPQQNRKDLQEIPDYVRKNLKFMFVTNVDAVIRNALDETRATAATSGKNKAVIKK